MNTGMYNWSSNDVLGIIIEYKIFHKQNFSYFVSNVEKKNKKNIFSDNNM